MVNENIKKLIEAISKDEDFQAKIQEAASQPPKRGVPEDKGLGSALLSAFAQSQGLNFGSSDLSELTQLLGAASQQGYGQSTGGGGLQLFGSAPQAAPQTAAPQTTGTFIPFGGSSAQPQPQQTAQTVTVDPAALEQFLQLFGGAQALQQQSQQQAAQQAAYQTQQAAQQSAPAGQFFSLGGNDTSSSSGSVLGQLFGLGGSGSSGSSGMNGMLLQLLMQLLLK